MEKKRQTVTGRRRWGETRTEIFRKRHHAVCGTSERACGSDVLDPEGGLVGDIIGEQRVDQRSGDEI